MYWKTRLAVSFNLFWGSFCFRNLMQCTVRHGTVLWGRVLGRLWRIRGADLYIFRWTSFAFCCSKQRFVQLLKSLHCCSSRTPVKLNVELFLFFINNGRDLKCLTDVRMEFLWNYMGFHQLNFLSLKYSNQFRKILGQNFQLVHEKKSYKLYYNQSPYF